MPNQLIPLRLSHVLRQSGVGSIVRGKDDLVIIWDTRYWVDKDGNPGPIIPYIERVRSALGIEQELREPPVASELKNGLIDGTCIPASRFPTWARCPSCSKLYRQPWYEQKTDKPHCTECNKKPKLKQLTWALAHEKGYLSEVPWHYLTHGSAADCKAYDQLYLHENGLERTLSCRVCMTKKPFKGNEHVNFSAQRMQPWTKEDFIENKEGLAQVLAINDTRIYSPVTKSAIVIPPESRVRKGTVVDRLYRRSEDRKKIDNARNSLARKSTIKGLASQYRCDSNDIEEALTDIEKGYPLYGENFTPGQLRESEYKAFLEILADQQPDEDLVTQDKSADWHALAQTAVGNNALTQLRIQGIDRLVRVDRLKAIQVFSGFRRLDKGNEGNEDSTVPPDIVGKSDWLPAIELYGEGLFITLNEDRLRRWEQNEVVQQRVKQLEPRFVMSGRNEPQTLDSRFLLLHTLSHLLERQIEAEGGYPAASLSEIIYSSTSPVPMSGILIYVAVPDIAGSLGGLTELAEPKRFLGILTRALERAQWCSLDPVCSEHEGQGPGLLNRAACHACALVPEPACNYGNTLLDRCFVKGDDATGLPAFFEMT